MNPFLSFKDVPGKKSNKCYAFDPSLDKNGWSDYCTLIKKRSNHASAQFTNGSIWITGKDSQINTLFSEL